MLLGLRVQRSRLGLEGLDCVRAGGEAGWGLLERRELDDSAGELGGVATLLPIHTLPRGDNLPGLPRVVGNGGLSVGRRLVAEQFGAEKARLDQHRANAERGDLGG